MPDNGFFGVRSNKVPTKFFQCIPEGDLKGSDMGHGGMLADGWKNVLRRN